MNEYHNTVLILLTVSAFMAGRSSVGLWKAIKEANKEFK